MKITNLHTDDADRITLLLDDGSEVALSPAYAGIVKELMLKQELRSAITNILDEEIEEGTIDMDRHEYSREDFEEEIYVDFEEDIELGDYSALSDDGRAIREKIIDTADYYELTTD